MMVIKREQNMVHNIKMTIDMVITQEEFGGTFILATVDLNLVPGEFLPCLNTDTF